MITDKDATQEMKDMLLSYILRIREFEQGIRDVCNEEESIDGLYFKMVNQLEQHKIMLEYLHGNMDDQYKHWVFRERNEEFRKQLESRRKT